MKKRAFGYSLLTTVLTLLLACVTINVYFPEEEIQDLAQQIEAEVQKRAAEIAEEEGEQTADDEPAVEESAEDEGNRSSLLETLLGFQPAYAQDVATPEVSNPGIRKIIDSRARRVSAINQYKSSGVLGENNRALLEIRQLDAISDLRERADAQKLVREENADRERMYEEIAVEKNIDRSQLPRIRENYAARLRENARSGDWIQRPDGRWQQK